MYSGLLLIASDNVEIADIPGDEIGYIVGRHSVNPFVAYFGIELLAIMPHLGNLETLFPSYSPTGEQIRHIE